MINPLDSHPKTIFVQEIFHKVASRYDLMNDLMSWRIHRLWKEKLIDLIKPHPHHVLLDVAGGTGDIALRYVMRGGGYALICDLSESMSGTGHDRVINHGILDRIAWSIGQAERLPIASCSIDVYTIAFGLRHVTNIEAVLREAYRVLKIGGRFFCLEFSRVRQPLLRAAYDQYSRVMLPLLGRFVVGDSFPYRYLIESIRLFPNQAALLKQITAVGFSHVRYRSLSGGIAAIHSGWRT